LRSRLPARVRCSSTPLSVSERAAAFNLTVIIVEKVASCGLFAVFQGEPGDKLAVVLHEVDPTDADDFALSHWVCEYDMVAAARDGGPFTRADLGHVFARARIDKLDHDHGSLVREIKQHRKEKI
jgi:hypothetical protein